MNSYARYSTPSTPQLCDAKASSDLGEAKQQPLIPTNADMNSQNVTVSVRVRPFNGRELDLGLPLVVRMAGTSTRLLEMEGTRQREYRFNYDNSFWSHDPADAHFVDQAGVYRAIGRPLVGKALEGYNCCLFAYGQTGSGKSHSMMGPFGVKRGGAQDGVIPRFGRDLFERMAALQEASGSAANDTRFTVELSYFEIYAERIYDLLASPQRHGSSGSGGGGSGGTGARLRVREHPVLGPYVDGLATYAAESAEDIEAWITVGGKHRATASTNMNATSSRSHAVFTMTLTQTETGKEDGEEHSKVSKINLVDLAGSERSDVAGTSGVRLREAAHINKSLHTLGKVISSLAESSTRAKKAELNGGGMPALSSGGTRKIFVPYRDSVLTWILKDSLGGNSKTAMLATISPSLANYDETLSTLRYAHEARKIVNVAQVNEDPNIRLIRDLKEEIEFLRNSVGGGSGSGSGGTFAEVQSLRAKLKESERLMSDMNRTWADKVREAERVRRENAKLLEEQGLMRREAGKIDNKRPSLVNLNEDPSLAGVLLYMIREGDTNVGSAEGADMRLGGVFVAPQHCVLHCNQRGTDVSVSVLPDADVFVNGHEVKPGTVRHTLEHGDRIVFGNHHFFRLSLPLSAPDPAAGAPTDIHDYRFARRELEEVQAKRLEAEVERERQRVARELAQRHERETEEALQAARVQAARELELQRAAYEAKLVAIEQSQEQLAMGQAAEDERLTRALEDQRAQLLHERLLMEQRFAEEAEQALGAMRQEAEAQNDIIARLEAEKQKIFAEVQDLQQANEQDKASKRTRNDLYKFSVDVQEANKMAEALGQDTVFKRDGGGGGSGGGVGSSDGGGGVTVSNGRLGIYTTWSRERFDSMLVRIREAYRHHTQGGGAPDASVERLFYDPEDDWRAAVPRNEEEEEEGNLNSNPNANPNNPNSTDSTLDRGFSSSSSVGGKGLAQSLSRAVSSSSASVSALEGRPEFDEMMETVKQEAREARRLSLGPISADSVDSGVNNTPISPRSGGVSVSSGLPSVASLCRQYISNAVASIEATAGQQQKERSVTDEIVATVSTVKKAADMLLSTPLARMDAAMVQNASMSVALSVEALANTVRMGRATAGSSAVRELYDNMGSTVATLGANAAKILHGVDRNIEAMVSGACADVFVDVEAVGMLAGEIAVATSGGQAEASGGGGEEETAAAELAEAEEAERAASDDGCSAFAEDEAALAHGTSSLMPAAAGNQRSNPLMVGVDETVLRAFERGAHRHIEQSLAGVGTDLKARAAKLSDLALHSTALTSGGTARLDTAVLIAASEAAAQTVTCFGAAAALQANLTHSNDSLVAAHVVFYRKNYARVKGIFGHVQEAADAVSWLAEAAAAAASGADDAENLAARSKSLRTAVSHLVSAADARLGTARPHARLALVEALREAAGGVFKATAALQKACTVFSASAAGQALRKNTTITTAAAAAAASNTAGRNSLQRSPLAPRRREKNNLSSAAAAVSPSMTVSTLSTPGSPGTVRARMRIIEQQASVLRLENELSQSRRVLASLNRSQYHGTGDGSNSSSGDANAATSMM